MVIADYSLKICKFQFYSGDSLIQSLDDTELWKSNEGIRLELKAICRDETVSFENGILSIPTLKLYLSIGQEQSHLDEDDDDVLSHDLLRFLEVPTIGGGLLSLKSRYTFSSAKFEIQAIYYLLNAQGSSFKSLNSPLIEWGDGQNQLILYEQYLALSLIDNHMKTGPHEQEENFKIGAQLREFSLYAPIELTEGRLAKDDIEHVESIRPVFTATDDGGVDLGLEIDSGNEKILEKAVSESTDSQVSFSVVKDNKLERKRFVLSEDAQKAINTYKKKNHFTREEKRDLLNNPEESLPGFDLADYGDRVIGFGLLYAPTVNPIQGDDKQEWAIDLLAIEPDISEDASSREPQIPRQFPIDENNAKEILKLIEEAKAHGLDSFIIEGNEILITDDFISMLKKVLPKNETVGLLTKSNIDEITYDEITQNLIELKLPSEFFTEMSGLFNDSISLYPYQQYGFGWFEWINSNSSPGCLLADDMGMGKTYQVAAFLAHQKDVGKLSPTLLVLPPILITNWEEELQSVFPSATFYHASGKIGAMEREQIESCDITAITYQNQLRNQQQLGKIEFKNIICDEAQHIKNPAAARTRSILAMQGEFKIALTATPIENTISELWSILDYSVPGYLPPLREFNKYYGGSQLGEDQYTSRINELSDKLEPIVLRRLKDEFLAHELPSKSESYEDCFIDELQVDLQNRIQSTHQKGEVIPNFFKYFRDIVMALTNPELLNGEYGVLFPTDYLSPKLKRVFELLDEVKKKNEKCLIFADRHIVQAKLKEVLEARYGIVIDIINGNTPKLRRDQFTKEYGKKAVADTFGVLLLSPKCAGFGLNLIGANHVIHYLRNFNPAVENQATDRVYRIGQMKPVHVYYLIGCMEHKSIETVEQKLHNLIESKRYLLKNYLTASQAGKIATKEFAQSMNVELGGMTITDVDQLKPLLFEEFCANLFALMGYSTQITPINDFGADVIAIGHSSEENALIQCKHKLDFKTGTIGNDAIKDILGAKATYEREMQLPFNKLLAFTNGMFSKAAKIQAKTSGVKLIDRERLKCLLVEFPLEF